MQVYTQYADAPGRRGHEDVQEAAEASACREREPVDSARRSPCHRLLNEAPPYRDEGLERGKLSLYALVCGRSLLLVSLAQCGLQPERENRTKTDRRRSAAAQRRDAQEKLQKECMQSHDLREPVPSRRSGGLWSLVIRPGHQTHANVSAARRVHAQRHIRRHTLTYLATYIDTRRYVHRDM